MQVTHIQDTIRDGKFELPLATVSVSAGFPSPADDFIDTNLDLNEHLVRHPAATFFVRVSGDLMKEAGIFDKDILIVDRSLEYQNGTIIIAVLNGELVVKRLKIKEKRIFLQQENGTYSDVEVTNDEDFRIWGVVTSVIHTIINY